MDHGAYCPGRFKEGRGKKGKKKQKNCVFFVIQGLNSERSAGGGGETAEGSPANLMVEGGGKEKGPLERSGKDLRLGRRKTGRKIGNAQSCPATHLKVKRRKGVSVSKAIRVQGPTKLKKHGHKKVEGYYQCATKRLEGTMDEQGGERFYSKKVRK